MSQVSKIQGDRDVSGWIDPTMDSVKGTETPKDPDKGYIALLGWSVNAIKAAQKFDRRYVVVAPDWAADFCEANKIPYMPWDFVRLNDRSMEIAETLKAEGVDVAIPLFEETVEWSGAINSVLMDNPRMYGQSILFRDKALMKRRAQLGGIRVGIFEEAHEKDDIVRFMKRVNQTLLKLDGDPDDPIHVKAFDKAGCLGHRMIRKIDEIDSIPAEEYPLLMESHLDGWEFAVEAWIHDGEIKFLNISEYVTLGYSVFVPATRELESWRHAITQQIKKLIKTFDIQFGLIHPEYFVAADGEMYFGEVAYRPRASRPSSSSSVPMASTPIRLRCWSSIRRAPKRKSRHSFPAKWRMQRAMPVASASIRGGVSSANWKCPRRPSSTRTSSLTN
jgi:hypothetical protein